jgi:hypothetical protein
VPRKQRAMTPVAGRTDLNLAAGAKKRQFHARRGLASSEFRLLRRRSPCKTGRCGATQRGGSVE